LTVSATTGLTNEDFGDGPTEFYSNQMGGVFLLSNYVQPNVNRSFYAANITLHLPAGSTATGAGNVTGDTICAEDAKG
jgi:hypothetical protein